MYVRQARKGDEDWLLTQFEELDIDAYDGFRSRDYVIAVQTQNGGEDCGFGRITVRGEMPSEYAVFTHIAALPQFDAGHVRSRVLRHLFHEAEEKGCDEAYLIAEDCPEGFEFEEVTDEDTLGDVSSDSDELPVFKANVLHALGKKTEQEKLDALADEFEFDDDATTKYSTD